MVQIPLLPRRVVDTGGMLIAALIWAALGLIAVVVEMLVLDFTFLLLGIAAGGAALAAALGAGLPLQLAVFGVLAILGLAVVRPIVRKRFKPTRHTKTNVDALIGAHAKVLEEVTPDGGLVLLNGEHWSARVDRHASRLSIEPGVMVHVLRIDGATAIVHTDQ